MKKYYYMAESEIEIKLDGYGHFWSEAYYYFKNDKLIKYWTRNDDGNWMGKYKDFKRKYFPKIKEMTKEITEEELFIAVL